MSWSRSGWLADRRGGGAGRCWRCGGCGSRRTCDAPGHGRGGRGAGRLFRARRFGGYRRACPTWSELRRRSRCTGERLWRLKQADGQALLIPVEARGRAAVRRLRRAAGHGHAGAGRGAAGAGRRTRVCRGGADRAGLRAGAATERHAVQPPLTWAARRRHLLPPETERQQIGAGPHVHPPVRRRPDREASTQLAEYMEAGCKPQGRLAHRDRAREVRLADRHPRAACPMPATARSRRCSTGWRPASAGRRCARARTSSA